MEPPRQSSVEVDGPNYDMLPTTNIGDAPSGVVERGQSPL